MDKHDNIVYEKNQRESIDCNISVSIVTQRTTYDLNDQFWDSI